LIHNLVSHVDFPLSAGIAFALPAGSAAPAPDPLRGPQRMFFIRWGGHGPLDLVFN
jgi:hypothetical protein